MERRLAAILAADMVGFSRLVEIDEADTIERHQAIVRDIVEPAVTAHGGRIFKQMGDGFLVEFSSVVDAMQSAVDIQRAVAAADPTMGAVAEPEADRRIQYRIGVNIGDVLIDGDDIFGDAVNVAARLETAADPGGVCVSGAAYDQLKAHVSVGYQPMGELDVKNIIQPVRAFRVLLDGAPGQAMPAAARPRRFPARRLALAALILVFAAAAGAAALFWKPRYVQVQEARTVAIAVLPFENLSDDPEQAYFIDGVTEDIATDLSKLSGVAVASVSAARRFAKSDAAPQDAVDVLGVSHLLEGSIRREGAGLRITAKLIEAESGAQVWAERYDRSAQDVFAIQEEIAQQVAAALAVEIGEIGEVDRTGRRRPKIAAYDAYVRGRAQRIPPTPANLIAALASFSEAIELDPEFAGGYAGASVVRSLAYSIPETSEAEAAAHLAEAIRLAEQAVALDPNFGPAWAALAEAKLRQRDFDAALNAAKRAAELAPNDSLMRATLGRFLGFTGDPDLGVVEVKAAMRMSPDSLPMLFYLGANLRAAGKFDAAIETLQEHRRLLGDRVISAPTAQLAAAYVQVGRLAEAQRVMAELLTVYPGYSLRKAARAHPFADPKAEQAFLDALKAAGAPE